MQELIIGVGSAVLVAFVTIYAIAKRYKRCPPDRILVIFGKTAGAGRSARCFHGGGAFVWPIIQFTGRASKLINLN